MDELTQEPVRRGLCQKGCRFALFDQYHSSVRHWFFIEAVHTARTGELDRGDNIKVKSCSHQRKAHLAVHVLEPVLQLLSFTYEVHDEEERGEVEQQMKSCVGNARARLQCRVLQIRLAAVKEGHPEAPPSASPAHLLPGVRVLLKRRRQPATHRRATHEKHTQSV